MDPGLERAIAATLAEMRHAARRVRSARHDAPRPTTVTREGDAVNETTTEPTPARADVLRDRLIEAIADHFDAAAGGPLADLGAADLSYLAEAANALDQVARRVEASAATPAPAINVERLCADVWHATQEPDVMGEHFPGFATGEQSFAATAIGDVAVAAIRKVLA